MKKKVLLLFLVFTIKALSQSGEIDTTFGNNGKMTTGLGSNQNFANAIAFQPDGKFLVGGSYVSSRGDNDFALARYNSDGSLDPSFGINGKAVTNFLEFNSDYNFIHSIQVLPNGQLIVSGTISIGGSGSVTSVIVRYNANGTIDTSFGTNGKTVSELISFDRDGKLIFLPDGKFIFTAIKTLAGGLNHIGIEKYTEDGLLDTSFGANGQVVTSFGTGNSWPCCIALKPDGKFVIAGRYPATISPQITIAQYNPNGTLDTGFDTDGKLITSFGTGTSGLPMQLSVNPDGKIKIAGIVGSTVSYFALVQYNPNGSLDTSFDGDGKALSPFPEGETFYLPNSVARQPDGKYLLVLNPVTLSPSSDFVVRRYNSDSSMDTAFGTAGTVSTTFGTGLNEAQSAAVSPDGKIFVFGKSQPLDFGYMDFAIARYDSSGALDPALDGDGKLTTVFEMADDKPGHLLVQPDEKLIAIGTSGYQQQNGTTVKNVALSRYNSDGSPDATFGNSGKTVSVFGDHVNTITTAALQADGKIVLANMYAVFADPSYYYEIIRYNADGSLDTAFGTNGKVSTNFYAGCFAFQPDGKILVAGGGTLEGTNGFILSRYSSNGTLDTSFDTDGHLPVSFGHLASGNASVMVQPDGKIIFSGGTYNADLATGTFAAARFNPDGSPDTSFGDNGQVVTPIASTCIALKGFIQADGKILIAGTSDGIHFSSVQYHANGTIDTMYGTAGITTTDLHTDSYYGINSVALQPDGKFLLAVTQYGQDPNSNDFKIKRINPDGTFDDDFGGQDGIATSFYDGYDEAFAIGLQSGDKIVVAGPTHNGMNTDFALARFTNVILDVAHFNGDSSGLVIYPNPAKDNLHIKTTVNGLEVIDYSIYNMLGQLIYKNSGEDLEIWTANFSSGIYNIAIYTNKGTVSKKFVKE